MIERVDEKLAAWAESLLDDVEVLLGPPEEKATAVVGLYLIDILPASPAHVTRRAPLQVMLQYLITAWGKTPMDAHRMLGRLLFSAMEHPEYEVDLGEVPAQVWHAFGVRPRPSFRIRLPLRVERSDLTTQRVGGPVELHRSSLSPMQGIVLGPGRDPLGNAHVALPSFGLSSTTDSRGRFSFDAVPLRDAPVRMHITARGREMVKTVAPEEMTSGALTIHFDL